MFTVADLLSQVLRPIAEHRGLDTWEKLVEFASVEWYPSRIAFGKHKGRLFQEARGDAELRRWLDWLANSSNPRTATMGRWYLRRLEIGTAQPDTAVFATTQIEGETGRVMAVQEGHAALVIYVNPELEQLRQLVAGARARLAGLEVDCAREKSRVDATQAVLFQHLREHYQKRDRLRLVVGYRQKYLDSLMRGGEEEAKQAEQNYEKAKAQSDQDYEETSAAVAGKKQLSAEDEAELTRLWKKLVELFHPDRFTHQPDKLETYEKLTSAINQAKDNGDIGTLREIANDPHGFILRQGWTSLDFSEEKELGQLRRLRETLQLEIITVLESLKHLRESPDFELCQLSEHKRVSSRNRQWIAAQSQTGNVKYFHSISEHRSSRCREALTSIDVLKTSFLTSAATNMRLKARASSGNSPPVRRKRRSAVPPFFCSPLFRTHFLEMLSI